MLLTIFGKHSFYLQILALVVAGIGSSTEPASAAQAPSEAPPKPSAARTIILPRKLVAGQRATLAVLDIQGRLTPSAVVEFSAGTRVVTNSTGRAAFTVPAKSRVLFAHLEGRPDSVSSLIMQPSPSPEPGLRVSSYPAVVALADRFEVSGTGFSGDSDANGAKAGGKVALILAASPLAVVVLPAPGLPQGPSEFSVESHGHTAGPFPISFVSLEVGAAKHSLAANERGVLTVRVHGSSGRLLIEARNLSPEILSLGGGNIQRTVSSGGPENVARFELRGLHGGDFTISVHLIPRFTSLPPA